MALSARGFFSFRLFRRDVVQNFSRHRTHDASELNSSSYVHRVGDKPLRHVPLGGALAAAARRWPSRAALVAREERVTLTYQQLLEQADRLGGALRALGLSRGDRLAIWAPNCSQWVVAMFAAARSGLVSVAINPLYQKNEIEYCLKKVGAKAVLTPETYKGENYYRTLTDLIPEMRTCTDGQLKSSKLEELKHVILLTEKDDLPGVIPYNKLMAGACAEDVAAVERAALAVSPDAGCNIQFTSGTTGNPKAALLSHHNIVNNGFYIGLRNELNERHTKICVQVPLFHVFGVVVTLSSAVQHGATVVLPSGRYSPTANLEALVTEKCDSVYGTPTMHIDLVNAVRKSGVGGLRVRTAVTGGSPVTPRLVQDLERTLGLSCVKSIFGMTEGTAVSFQSLPGEDQERPLYYIGALQNHLEAKVVDDQGDTVPFGEPGELWIRGYSVMTGYWGESTKTADTKRPDGWLRTGDQIILHEDGYGQIVGRLKDLIIRGGENIAPKEIEDVLTAHPNVLDCQVIGVHDDRLGEEICAIVRLKEGASFDTRELSRHCQNSLAKYKTPRIFKEIDSFPKTASGKVQKYKLRNMIESGKL